MDRLLMRLEQRPSGRMPDVVVVDHARAAHLQERWLEGPALLVVEVISEDSVARDTVEKRAEDERAGVTEYMIIEARDNRQGFTYLRLDNDGRYRPVEPDADGRYHSVALPGFWLEPTWLARDPLPEAEPLMLQIAPAAYRRYLAQLLGE
jgi:Uma2 family endonuclease